MAWTKSTVLVGYTELGKLCDLGQVLLYQLIYDRLKGVGNLGRPGWRVDRWENNRLGMSWNRELWHLFRITSQRFHAVQRSLKQYDIIL